MQSKKHKTRVAAWLLALIMMFSLIPGNNVQVQAAGSEGTSADTVALKVDQRQKVEVALAVGSTKQNYANFENDLKAALKERGVENEDVSFVEVDANATSSKDSFEWWTYDHSTDESINHTNHSYITKTNAYTYETNEYDSCSRHIQSSSGGATMSFYGYGQMGYTDFNYLPNTQATKKTIEFTIQEKEAHDALDGLGFLVNASITGNSYSTQVINGYLIFLQYNGATGTAIKLFQLKNVSAAALHDGSKGVMQDFSGISGITLLKTADTSYSSDHKYRKIKIEIMPTYLKMWYNGSTSDNQSKVLNASDLVRWGNTTEYPLTPGYDKDGNKEVYRGGYGPVASYGSHACKQLTLATLSNLKMEAEYVRSLTEVVREPNWSDDKLSFLVNLNEDPIDDFSEDFTTAEIINRLEQDKVTYIGWCGDNNADASKVFVDGISSGSGLVNMNDSKFIASGENYYSSNSYQKQVDEIARLIVEKISKQTTTGGVYTYLDTDEFHFSSTGATLNDGNWSVGYSTESFDKAKDSVNNYSDLASASFLLPGYYEVYYGGDTDTPKAKIRIHQAPKALFTATADEDGTLTVSNTSYDPEVCKDGANADGTENSGIISSKFEYRNVTDQGEWQEEVPATIDDNKVWMVRLTVTDADGATDMLVQQVTKKSSSGSAETTKPPFNAFTLSKSQYIKNIDENIEIIDQSYSLDGNKDFTVEYTITGNGKTITLNDFAPQTTYTYALTNLSTGSYTISMIARNSSATSQKVSKTFTVKEGYAVTYNANGDNVAGLPGTQYKIKGTELALSTVAPSRTGYIFAGWATSEDGEIKYQPGSSYSENAALALYAVWKKPFTYQAEGYTGVYDGENHNITVTVTQPENADGITISYAIATGDQEPSENSYTDKPEWKDAGTYKVYYKIAKDGYLTVSGYRSMQIDKAQPTVTLANKVYQKENGSALTIDAPTVTGVKKENITDGTFTYTYYTDKELESKTTSLNGASSNGAAPSKKGIYYVVAHFNGNTNYKAADSNIATMYIAPDVYYIDANSEKVYGSFAEIVKELGAIEDERVDKTVYVDGDVVVDTDVTIPSDVSLEIATGKTLTIDEDIVLTNEGEIWNQGTIAGSGNVVNRGTISNGAITSTVTNESDGQISRVNLENKVSNFGTINNATGTKITNESEDAEVTKKGKNVYFTVTYNAVNGLSSDNAAKVTTPDADKIPWGDKLSTLTLPEIKNIEDVAEFEGWYMEQDCNNPAIEEAMGVNSNITLYAKWKEYGSYEAYWTDKSGEKHYGSWDEILKDMEQHPEDVDEVHIQNPVDIDEDTKLPDGAKLYVDAPNGEIQLEDGVQLEVPGGIDNDGTIKPKNDAPATKPTIKAPVDNKKQMEGVTVDGDVNNEQDATITDATITGDLKNDGDVTDSKVDGNVTNNETGKLDDVTIPEGKLDNSGSYSEGGKTLEYAVTFMVNGKPDTVEAQTNIPYAGKAAYVRPELTEGQVFSGWYENDDYTKLWKFDQNVVVKNLTLYAKVSETAEDYVTSWKDENGDTTYGSLQDALDSGSKDIHIRKNCTIPDGTTIPEDVSVTVDDGVVVTIPKNADVKVNGDLTNNGTISNGGTLSGNGTLDNKGTVYGGTIMPDVENNGKLDGTTLNGNVSNKENGKITDSTLNGTTRNEKGGKISDSTLNGSTTNDGRIDNCTIEGKIDNQENGKIVNSDFDQVQYTVTFDNDGHGKKPEDQVIGCGAKVKEPAQMKDTDYVFLGWYYNENEWKFDTDTVNRNITLKAQWKAKTSYEAYWYNEDGEKEYGSLEEAVKEPAKEEIHIQRPTDVTTDISVPNGTTLIIDENAELKVNEPGSLQVEESIINKGTLSGSPITANVDNQGIIGSANQPTMINGNVKNTGKITDSTIKGTTTNDKTGTIENSTLEGTVTNQGNVQDSNLNGTVSNEKNATITGGKVAGETTNKGSISDATLEGNIINQGILKGNEKEEGTTIDNKSPDAVVSDKDGKEITYTVTFENNGYGEALQQQTIAYGKVVAKPAALLDDVYTLKGWYADVNLTNVWNFEKDVVTSDITLYAKWMPKADYEASWTEDGQTVYGSLEEAIAAGAKDIHIQKDLTIQKDTTIPEGTTVTVEDKKTVTIPEGVTVTVPAGAELINHGTIQNQSEIAGEGNVTNNGTLKGSSDSTVNTTVINNGRVSDSQLNGSVENNGVVKDTTLNGDVKNTGKINDCEINAGLKNDGNGKVTVDGDEVVYKDQIVKGKVTKGDNKENIDSTTITFQQGSDKKVGSGEVKDGLYQVDKLPNGYYNVVIPSEDGSKVNTFFVKVTDDEIQMKEFNLPDGNLSDQVVVKEGTPKIVVDGLAQMLTDAVDQNTAGVTSEDQRIAKNGGDVDITFTATQIAAIPDTDVDLEKVIKEDNKSVGMNLDLSVLKTVTTTKDDDTTKTETYLKELNKPIMVHIPVPTEKQGKKGYIIYRSHTDQDGKTTVDKITEEKNADGEYIEVAKNGSAITLYTKKFSTYVLAFDPDKTEEPDQPDTPDVPDKPDTPNQPDTPDDKPNVPEQGNNNSTEQTTTEAPKTSEGLESLPKQQKKDAKKLMQTLGLTEAEAVEIMRFAMDNNISMDTLLVSDTTITSQKNDKDIKGSSFARIQAATGKLDKTSVKLKWNKVNGADGYLVFGNKCGKGNKYQFIKDVKGVKTNLGLKKLKKGTYYKYVVRAYKLVGDKKVTIALSKTVHATTKGGKYGVAKAVKVNKSKVNLKAGKTFTIKASEIKEDKTIRHHRDIVYESSDLAVATVDKHGVVKAVKKGSCYVYAYAQNGVYKKIKVTVK